ncbi:hypothetical protein ACN28S_35940 [Cystobacter fuscus]
MNWPTFSSSRPRTWSESARVSSSPASSTTVSTIGSSHSASLGRARRMPTSSSRRFQARATSTASLPLAASEMARSAVLSLPL